MSEEFSNDNSVVPADTRGPDAHCQAAMLLVESLLHGLIARKVISVAEAVEIVEVATEVTWDIGTDLGDLPATLRKSIDLLQSIGSSLKTDLPKR